MANDFDLQIKWLNGSQIEVQASDASAISGTEKVLVMDDGVAKEVTTQDIADLGGGAASYLVYAAILTQTDTNAPTATILENTIGNIVWTRDSAGFYIGTLAAAFPAAKTFCIASSTSTVLVEIGNNESAEPSSEVFIRTGNSDNALYLTSIEIRVYP